ncbi:sigma factor-like helix-turn-helix DNA-binding protein [Sorangium sp. So ce321]|uniref:sigma factor-like helix-turn-helix DNA-binding protein n=1 Tax=Sorangium sp. So ce321 TaxID=3133300 RepID=UPI003F6458BA
MRSSFPSRIRLPTTSAGAGERAPRPGRPLSPAAARRPPDRLSAGGLGEQAAEGAKRSPAAPSQPPPVTIEPDAILPSAIPPALADRHRRPPGQEVPREGFPPPGGRRPGPAGLRHRPGAVPPGDVEARALLELLSLVEPRKRRVLLLGGEGEQVSEVARSLGLPAGTAFSRLRRGRRRLATVLKRRAHGGVPAALSGPAPQGPDSLG